MKTVLMADPVRYPRMNTDELRDTFLLRRFASPARSISITSISIAPSSVSPLRSKLPSPCPPIPIFARLTLPSAASWARSTSAARASSLSKARVTSLDNLDVLYIGRGNKQVTSLQKTNPRPPSTTS